MIFSCGESRRCKNHSAFNGKSNRFAADRFAAAVEPRRERGGAQRSLICPRPLLSWRSLAWIAFICLNLPHLTGIEVSGLIVIPIKSVQNNIIVMSWYCVQEREMP